MNRNLIFRALGLVLLCEALALTPSLFLSIYYRETSVFSFVVGMLLTGTVGFALSRVRLDSPYVGYKEGFAIATLGWLFLVIFGSIPFLVAGTFEHPVDAFFETMSGFTTTGASVIVDVETLPRSILLWRSLTHWLGGMGIIVLTVALIPSLKIAALHLFRAEVPGPTKNKVLPRVAQTSRELYRIYLLITVAEVVLLKLAGLSWFDSVIHTFGTVATGGFSNKNLSIGAYDSLAVELIVITFMIICGMNFALHHHVLKGNFQLFLKDPELRLYLGIIAVSTLFIGFNLTQAMAYPAGEAFRAALFQVSSILTTTGFCTVDFNRWPATSQAVLLVLMFIGGCTGSTGGAIKQIRLLILIKCASRQITRLLHPHAVVPIRLGNQVISPEVLGAVQSFFFIYICIFVLSTLFIASLGLDLVSAASAVAATLGNVGPGLGMVGPASNYASLPVAGKAVLAICMLIGRLEIYTVLVVVSTKFWRS